MRAPILAAAVAIAGCAASSPPSATKDARTEEKMGKRVDEICALPPEERKVALEKFKKETGFAVFCGDSE